MSNDTERGLERQDDEVPWGFHQLVALLSHQGLRVLATAFAIVVTGVLWLGTTVPLFQSSATLLLQRPSSSGGGLSALLGGGSDDNAAELVVMQSRAVVERTVERAADLEDPLHDLFPLGLATRVEDIGLRPLHGVLDRLRGGGGGGRLYARLTPPGDRVRVTFKSADRVVITSPASWTRLPSVSEQMYRPGAEILLGRQMLTLLARGDVVGRTFEIRGMAEDDSIASLRSRVSISERARGSGAIVVTVTDHDPRMAADLANAVSDTYLEIAQARDDRRGSRTADFIDAQLAEQHAELEKAEAELVHLQVETPESINPDSTAASLIAQVRQLESEKIRLAVMEQSFHEAIDLLDEKNEQALSRLDTQFLDSLSLRYINHMVDISTKALTQDRTDTGPYRYLMRARVAETRGEAERIRLWRDALVDAIERHRAGDATALSRLSTQGVLGMSMDSMTVVLMNELGRLQAQRDQQAGELTEEHPTMAALARSIADVEQRIIDNLTSRMRGFEHSLQQYEDLIRSREQQLSQESSLDQGSIETALIELRTMTRAHVAGRLAGITTQRQGIEREIQRIEGDLAALPENTRRLAGPTRRVAAHQAMVAFLTESKHESQVKQLASVTSAEVVDRAIPPRARSKPRMGLSVMLLVAGGLTAGLFYASIWERYRGGLRSARHLTLATGLPVLGVIPDFRSTLRLGGAMSAGFARSPRFLPLRDEPHGETAEAFRAFRSQLVATTGRDPSRLRTIAVTSCTRGEGRTVTAIELARAFRKTGERVLLIDADLREPAVHRYLDGPSSPGLAQVLREEVAWRDVLQSSDEPGFDFIATGGVVQAASDLLTSRRMERVMQEMCAVYDLVVCEFPPILQVSDVCQVAPQFDVLLLLVRCNGPPYAWVRDAARRAQSAGARVVGGVMVAARSTTGELAIESHAHVS